MSGKRQQEHSIGITKGAPILGRNVNQRTLRSDSEATWHGVCSCGWAGEDHREGIEAQNDALSHQSGKPVRRTVLVRKTVTRHSEVEEGEDRLLGQTFYELRRS